MARRDIARYRKLYSYKRQRPRYEALASEAAAFFESFAITLDNTTSGSYAFTESFPDVPVVTVTAVDAFGTDQVNVNVYIKNLSIMQVDVETSAQISGSIHMHALYVV